MTFKSAIISIAATTMLGVSMGAAPASAENGATVGASLRPLFGVGAEVDAGKKSPGVSTGFTVFGLALGANIGAHGKSSHKRLRNQFTPPRPGLNHGRYDGEGFYFR